MERNRFNMNRIGKILPVEGYFVVVQESLPMDYAKSLTHLYQPLIGLNATILYQTLLHERDILGDKPTPQTHHTLMNYLNLPLDEIYTARLKLEGIGLLKTYQMDNEANRVFTYVLLPVYSPERFFQDPMLSQLLYHHIGPDKYDRLKQHFLPVADEKYGINITASFQDVFETITSDFQPNVKEQSLDRMPDIKGIDFAPIEQSLKQRMIPEKKVLTGYNRKLISQMMFLYDLATYEVEKAVIWALTEDNSLNIEEFKAACYDLFQSKYKGSHVRLIDKTEKVSPTSTEQKTPKTKEEKLIQHFETISPKQLLEDLSGGHQASEQDLRLVGEVMTSQGLPTPVMNVLIHYVLLQTNMKLTKNYLSKIASHWSRANLKTAKEAMDFAKLEVKNNQKAKNTRNNYSSRQSKEVIPDWFKEQKQRQKQEAVATYEEQVDEVQEQKEIAALLKQYSSNDK